MKLTLAVIYEDNDIFIKYTPEEFVETMQEYIDDGKSVKDGMDLMITELKRRTISK